MAWIQDPARVRGRQQARDLLAMSRNTLSIIADACADLATEVRAAVGGAPDSAAVWRSPCSMPLPVWSRRAREVRTPPGALQRSPWTCGCRILSPPSGRTETVRADDDIRHILELLASFEARIEGPNGLRDHLARAARLIDEARTVLGDFDGDPQAMAAASSAGECRDSLYNALQGSLLDCLRSSRELRDLLSA